MGTLGVVKQKPGESDTRGRSVGSSVERRARLGVEHRAAGGMWRHRKVWSSPSSDGFLKPQTRQPSGLTPEMASLMVPPLTSALLPFASGLLYRWLPSARAATRCWEDGPHQVRACVPNPAIQPTSKRRAESRRRLMAQFRRVNP
jgi:hypothetical protein